MRTDAVLVLTQWLSPAYPVGGFAYAHGLEQAVVAGWLTGAAGLQDWLRDLLTAGSLRCDAVLLRMGHDNAAGADAAARAFAAGAGRLQETDLQGAAFCQTLAATEGIDLGRLTYPVAVGQAARRIGVEVDVTVAVYLQAVVCNLVTGATRLMPLGQTEAQAILTALRPVIAAAERATRGQGFDDLHSAAWLSDIAAMQHETLSPRIFRT